MALETCGMDRQIVNADRIVIPIGAVETLQAIDFAVKWDDGTPTPIMVDIRAKIMSAVREGGA